MSVKAWIVGILVAISGLTGYGVHLFLGGEITESTWGVSCAPAMVVLEQKKRCGFVDLEKLVTIEGIVTKTKIHNDGDFSINVVPDPGYEWLLYYKDQARRNYVHTEFMPCERAYPDVETVLQEVNRRYEAGIPTRVRIMGRWAYDGVDHRGEWREQLEKCLETRDPDPSVGWLEIHPSYSVSIIE